MLSTPARHDPTLETELGLEEAAQGLAVSTTVLIINAVVRAHNITRAGVHGVLERPQVSIVRGHIVDIG